MFELPRFPKHLQLQTHAHCNMACLSCPHPTLEKNSDDRKISWNSFTSIIDECLANEEFESIVLDLQNEPLLDSDLAERIVYIKEKRKEIFVGITSNGMALSPEIVAALIEAGIDRIVVSLNAVSEAAFEKNTGSRSFRRIIKNVNNALKIPGAQARLKMSFGATSHNVQEVRQFVEHMESQHISYRIFAMHDRLGQVTGMPFLNVAPERTCHLPIYSMAVLLDGTAVLCCQDWLQSRIMGNVLNDGVGVVWQSPQYIGIRLALINKRILPQNPCGTCDAPYIRNSRVSFNYRQLAKLENHHAARWIIYPQGAGHVARDTISEERIYLPPDNEFLESKVDNSAVGRHEFDKEGLPKIPMPIPFDRADGNYSERGAPYSLNTVSLPRHATLEVESHTYSVTLIDVSGSGALVKFQENTLPGIHTPASFRFYICDGAVAFTAQCTVDSQISQDTIRLTFDDDSMKNMYSAFDFESPYELELK
jgi:MoaA/NifB/PqqE/SkfB family radical SAM enzyme